MAEAGITCYCDWHHDDQPTEQATHMPHRIRYLDEALDRIAGDNGLWQATLGEAAAHVQEAGGV